MGRYSWAVGPGDLFVICHTNLEEMRRLAPYGICRPVNGSSKWDLIDILEEQDRSIAAHLGGNNNKGKDDGKDK